MVVEFFTQPLLVSLKNRFTGNLWRFFETSPRKIFRWQAAGLVQNINKNASSVGVEASLGLGYGMGAQRLGNFFPPLIK
ncbi:hypothetical protein ES703_99396 [subsurface metagenome]